MEQEHRPEQFEGKSDHDLLIVCATKLHNLDECVIPRMEGKLNNLNHTDRKIEPRLAVVESRTRLISRILVLLLAAGVGGGSVTGILDALGKL